MDLETQVVNGISLAFVLIFFVPLGVVAAAFFLYCGLARRSVIRAAKILSAVWLVACVPASLLVLMGFAFNSAKAHPLLVLPLWIGAGLVALWLPVGMRVLFRIRPV